MQLHLLLAPDVVSALGLQLLEDLFVLFVRWWDRRLAHVIFNSAFRYLRVRGRKHLVKFPLEVFDSAGWRLFKQSFNLLAVYLDRRLLAGLFVAPFWAHSVALI